MARPPEPDKRAALAREAVAVLQRGGADMPVSQLAEALGVKRPTLLYHFPTRAHIVEAALEELLLEQWRYISERVERESHPIDRLYAQVRAVHAFHEGNEGRLVFLTQALAATAGPRLEAVITRASEVFSAHRKATVKRLRDGMREGTVAPCDAPALVRLVRAVIDGLVLQRVTDRVALGPVHELLWERVLAPLKLTPRGHQEGSNEACP